MSYIGFIGGLSGLLSIYQPDKILKIISNEMWNGRLGLNKKIANSNPYSKVTNYLLT